MVLNITRRDSCRLVNQWEPPIFGCDSLIPGITGKCHPSNGMKNCWCLGGYLLNQTMSSSLVEHECNGGVTDNGKKRYSIYKPHFSRKRSNSYSFQPDHGIRQNISKEIVLLETWAISHSLVPSLTKKIWRRGGRAYMNRYFVFSVGRWGVGSDRWGHLLMHGVLVNTQGV